jgi:release factor glutamine methyltransferase
MTKPLLQAPLTLSSCINQAVQNGLDRLDAQLLMLWALNKALHQRAWLMAHDQDSIDAASYEKWLQLVERRLADEPFAYIVGQQDFYGLQLEVSPSVLIPRPDTETLVDWALELAPQFTRSSDQNLLDLGTGSGAIVLAFKSQQSKWNCWAVDASEQALEVALQNSQNLNLAVQFYKSNWLENIPKTQQFSLIVSNPPYIVPNDSHLSKLQYEPISALVAPLNGLADLMQIIDQSTKHLMNGAFLLLEHGYDQTDQVQALLINKGFSQVSSRQDLGGNWRCTGGCWVF